jgi:hypothetical protein
LFGGNGVRKFNVTGLCIPDKHYMVNLDNKINEIIKLIEAEEYFTINRARQYGKTTIMNELYNKLKDEYLVIEISFEGLGDKAFSSENEFCESFINLVADELQFNLVHKDIIENWEHNKSSLDKFEELSKKITRLVEASNKEVIIMIDEVDKSSDNQLFLHFIGMLRTKYLKRDKGRDRTFKSVILAGVYDVKNLKLKPRADEEQKYNSPWNIAADFNVDMTFSPREISTMLISYEKDIHNAKEVSYLHNAKKINYLHNVEINSGHNSKEINYMHNFMNIEEMSKLICDYTSGYPFLVSKLCKVIEENLNKAWNEEGLKKAVNIILNEKNTLFDDLIKNIEGDKNLYNTVYDIVVEGKNIVYNMDAHEKGIMFSILDKSNTGKLKLHNKIFELRIYNYMIAKREMEKGTLLTYEYRTNFIDENGDLKIEVILKKFQQLMRAEYREKDKRFIEREGRLIFLAFIKPIINGTGFYFVEPETRQDNRMDVVITYNKKQYIIELKICNGESYKEKGIEQLCKYLEVQCEDTGYMIIFNFNKNKEYTNKWIDIDSKTIYEVIV